MDATQEHSDNLFLLLSFGTLLSVLATSIAEKAGFFRKLLRDPYRRTPEFMDVVTVFVIFFLLQMTLLPLIVYLWSSIQTGNWHTLPQTIPENEKIWISSLGIWLSAGGLWLFCFLFQPSALQVIKKASRPFYNFCFGAMAWLICYPIVFTLSQLVSNIVESIFQSPEGEQTALTLLKASINQPSQLAFFFLSIVLVTPIFEEFLFRGTLQPWLISKVGQTYGIILASLCFAALHYTTGQGAFNLELLPPIFVLSCYLGYLYERQRSLWAPIGLHATFNLVSCLLALI